MIILGVETSCDETAVSVVRAEGAPKHSRLTVLAQVVASQIATHRPYGGVVPNLAQREHRKNLPLVLRRALRQAKVAKTIPVDLIAVTAGPGLEPALWTGINFALGLGKKWRRPVVAVNHLEGHLAAAALTNAEPIKFPALALIVSGGHTELVAARRWGDYRLLGQTRDDAAGEAFDKAARLLDLPYPGGPALSALAEQGKSKRVKGKNFSLPRPMINDPSLDFSFSGLKTAVRYLLEKIKKPSRGQKAQIAAEFERAVVEVLTAKTLRAAAIEQPPTVIITGGVSANQKLREHLTQKFRERFPETKLIFPPPHLTGDNATMIAAAAFFNPKKPRQTIRAQGRLKLASPA